MITPNARATPTSSLKATLHERRHLSNTPAQSHTDEYLDGFDFGSAVSALEGTDAGNTTHPPAEDLGTEFGSAISALEGTPPLALSSPFVVLLHTPERTCPPAVAMEDEGNDSFAGFGNDDATATVADAGTIVDAWGADAWGDFVL